MKLELAQYRALEAFAKFGSDLDKSTQQQLRRGARLMEVMKQLQYSPVPVEEQVITIVAATTGYMDDLPTGSVKQYEQQLIDFMRASHADILDSITVKKEITEDVKTRLTAALDGFTERFKATLS